MFEQAIRYVEDHGGEITEVIIDELGGTRLKATFETGLVGAIKAGGLAAFATRFRRAGTGSRVSCSTTAASAAPSSRRATPTGSR
ncbi:hypothetical protein ABZU76_39955 [Amycolatopsis sp. NPDC005232]|uniref:hypothetical protein n=1 Tax=Amycolatopsis sp. NPDC005232 TaxID=3157027 RepID=UPI0033AE36B0